MSKCLVAAVRTFLNERSVAGPVVAAVSGGADSVALLRALHECGVSVVVAHANHGLRGADSDGDEAFVRGLASAIGVPVHSTRLAIPSNENLEGAARRLRYEWLERIAGECGATWIATGHSADDQAETVLHRLIRGTGVQGLRGIAATLSPPPLRARVGVGGGESEELSAIPVPPTLPRRGGGGRTVVRPMLAVTRSDVLEYLDSLDQSYRTDATNHDPRFTRNRIRHELLPLLTSFNPEIVAVLGRLAEQASETFARMESEAASLLHQVERPRAGTMSIFDKAALEAAPPVLVREVFRLVWRREGWPMDAMTYEHWRRAASLVAGDYPDGVRLIIAGNVVQLSRTLPKSS